MDGGGKKYHSDNILYLSQNFNNFLVLQGLGSEADIPEVLKDEVEICRQCNSARKISKILSFILFHIWVIKIIATDRNQKKVVITVGWNITLLGRIAKLMGNKWINFLDDPLLNIAISNKKNIKAKVLSAFLRMSKFADYTILINKDEAIRFSAIFNVPMDKIIDLPPVYINQFAEDNRFEELLSEVFKGQKIILFYGDMTYKHNMDALTYIKNNIVQKFRGIENKCKFVFAGKGTENFENDDICTYMGFLNKNELFTLIRRSYLVLAPIFEEYTSGIKTKVVNAISLGTPVLSTPAGVYGLETEDLPVFVSYINDFPSKLLELISNEREVEIMREKALNYSKKFYSERVMERWHRIINI